MNGTDSGDPVLVDSIQPAADFFLLPLSAGIPEQSGGIDGIQFKSPLEFSLDVLVCQGGSGVDFSEEKAKAVLLEHDIEILVDLNDGTAESCAWGCDLTYDYVRINGDYRT